MDFIEERRTLKRLRKLAGDVGSNSRKGTSKANPFQYTNTGYRPDLGVTVRSNWEANIARVFTIYGIKWEFEPYVFTFPIKTGTRAYTPDFYLPKTKQYVEVKGYLDTKSKTKIKRFKKYYPEEWNGFTFIISKYDKKAIEFAETLGIEFILFYEDFRTEYKSIVNTHWQGK